MVQQILSGFCKFFIALTDDRDIDFRIVMTETLKYTFIHLDHSLQTRVYIKQIFHRFLQTDEVHAIVKTD